MADLNNLLDDIETNEDDDQQLPHDEDDEGGDEVDLDDGEGEGQITAPRAGIPAVLAAAAQQRRRQLDQQQDDVRGLGAGREERDYQAASGKDFGDDDFGDDVDGYGGSGEGGEGRIPDQDYEQLKHLWTLELASPELMPQDSETVALHVEVLAGQEESVEDLLKQSKVNQQQQPGGGGGAGGATGELASLMAQILKMDLDRTRFMLVDLARSRMAKIENHALFNRTLVDRMTEEEVRFC